MSNVVFNKRCTVQGEDQEEYSQYLSYPWFEGEQRTGMTNHASMLWIDLKVGGLVGTGRLVGISQIDLLIGWFSDGRDQLNWIGNFDCLVEEVYEQACLSQPIGGIEGYICR